MRKLFIILFLCCSVFTFSQEKNISGFVNNNIFFSSDTTYIIDFNTRISSEATLTIFEGTKVLFESGASIIIDGGLNILGSAQNPVFISSREEDFQGFGFIISSHLGSDISIESCVFKDLLVPITFENEWFRENVDIRNSTFTNINSQQSSVNIFSLSQIYSTSCNFVFSQNSFINNNSTIYIGPLEDDDLNLEFSYNLFHSNIMLGKNELNPLNSVLCGNYDQLERRNKIKLFGNSFVNNIYVPLIDSVEVKEINFGITGAAETFEISENYMGNTSSVSDKLIHFYQNNKLPIVLLTNPSKIPSEFSPFHLWKVEINSEIFQSFNTKLYLEEYENKFTLHFNKGVKLTTFICIDFLYFDDESKTIKSECIPIENLIFNETSLSFSVLKNSIVTENKGAFIFSEFTSTEGELSPSLLFGESKLIYLNKYNLLENYLLTLKIPEKVELNILSEPSDLEGDYPKIQYGFSSGVMLYNGDLETNREDVNYSYSMSIYYNLTKNWKLKSSYVSGSVSSKIGLKKLNKFEFSSDILEVNMQIEHDLSHLKLFGITPYVSAGISFFHFDPVANFNNYTYHLSDLGTENQEEKYNLNSFSIPYEIGLLFPISSSVNFHCFTSFRKTFTDYIDDIGGGYANYNDVLNNRGEVAAYFSDPTYQIDNIQKLGDRGNPYNNDSFFFFHFGINKTIR